MSSGAAGDTQGKEEVTFTGARLGAAGCSQHTAGNQETQRDIRPEGNGNISDSTEPDGNSSPHRGKRKTISDKWEPGESFKVRSLKGHLEVALIKRRRFQTPGCEERRHRNGRKASKSAKQESCPMGVRRTGSPKARQRRQESLVSRCRSSSAGDLMTCKSAFPE